MIEEEKQPRQEIKTVARFLEDVLNFLEKNTKDGEEIACMVLTDTSEGNFWINGMCLNKVWEDGMLHMATKLKDAQMFHHVASNAKLLTGGLLEQTLRATEVKGKPQ